MKYSILLGCATAVLMCANAAVAKTSPVKQSLAESQAIALTQQNSNALVQSAAQKIKTDPKGALADLNRAIQADPKNYQAYFVRGILKYQKLEDHKGALGDLDRAIALNAKYAPSYTFRGVVKYTKFGDKKGAIADLDKSLALDEDYLAYAMRGTIRYDIPDKAGAIADYRKSRQIAQAKGDTEFVKTVTQQLKEWGVND
jgi:tetratricopeptide (TPR) repeat protein